MNKDVIYFPFGFKKVSPRSLFKCLDKKEPQAHKFSLVMVRDREEISLGFLKVGVQRRSITLLCRENRVQENFIPIFKVV